jgi:hypothetical protein
VRLGAKSLGHLGVIYQAANFAYSGRGTARSLGLLPDGSVLSDRAAAKVRSTDQGHRYVERPLVGHGATPRRPDEPGTTWLAGALRAQTGAVHPRRDERR